ncbi:MAG: hypothetical protein AB1815_14360 [Bacillota bacterium]
MDNALLYSAVRSDWEVVEIKERTIETTLGLLTFRRRYYKKRNRSGVGQKLRLKQVDLTILVFSGIIIGP